VSAVIGVGFVLEWGWATGLWPWPDSRYSYLFVGSIALAVAAATVGVLLVDDRAALTPGLLNVAVMLGGQAGYLVTQEEAGTAAVLGLIAVASVACWWRNLWLVPRDLRPLPGVVRASLGVFVVVLVASGLVLVLDAGDIFPWDLRPDTAVLFGWIFLGDACFFAYGVVRPYPAYAVPQLLAFLAYDLVLIGPFLARFDDDDHRTRLILYTAVLVFSAAVAVGYLLSTWREPAEQEIR
jgi:hypothetical protein